MLVLVAHLIYKKMENLTQYKNPYVNQYVAPLGYHFTRNNINYGRIVWLSNVDGFTIEKDEINTGENSK